MLGIGGSASAEPAGSTHAAATSITFVDTAGGANFQQFFKEIIPQAEKDLGITINYLPSSAPELLQRLQGGQANQDVVLLKPDGLTSLTNAGVPLVYLQARRPKIPNLHLVADADIKSVLGIPTHGVAVPFWRDQFGIIYDKAKIKNPPKSWQDFYNRRNEWAGHIGIIRPDATSGGGRIMLRDFLLGIGLDEKPPFSQIQSSSEWTQDLQKLRTFASAFYKPAAGSATDLFQQFAQGNVWITEYAIDFTLWSRDQGLLPKTVGATFFKSATYGGAAYLAVPGNISVGQKLAAFKFINWLLSLKTQTRMLTEMHEYPGISAWKKMPASAFKDIPTWTTVQAFRTPLENNDLYTWLTQNGMQLLGG
ncbi:MAG TPA: extracellular solute-binding protein [Gaiellaceae bacterium]|nr:extracellular solute-binding protein [Gaiellaceae bacterium]